MCLFLQYVRGGWHLTYDDDIIITPPITLHTQMSLPHLEFNYYYNNKTHICIYFKSPFIQILQSHIWILFNWFISFLVRSTSIHAPGLVVNGCINVVITTIERRFGLRSSQTGLVASGYDIASFLCLVPVTYFGGRTGASKPRWLGWGVVVMGLGSLTFAVPHFLVGSYRASGALSSVCSAADSVGGNGTGSHQVRIMMVTTGWCI